MQLNYLYNLIISVLTLKQLQRIFSERPNFDLRRMLHGAALKRLATTLFSVKGPLSVAEPAMCSLACADCCHFQLRPSRPPDSVLLRQERKRRRTAWPT